ncbi:cadherin-related family member 5-like isoform X6 [Chiloscyllium punctatum]|uniref:cadherin-related family member 5-like isoform X6 n=1 Tax=Chiloscyllium punctatum TaxID=137246 RepID=UPI003B636996
MDSSRMFCGPCTLLFVLFVVFQINVTAVANKHCSFDNACCVSENPMRVDENNEAGAVINSITINTPPIAIADPSEVPDVAINGSKLVLTKTIDYENLTSPVLIFTLNCGDPPEPLPLIIEIHNVNDNPPKFPQKVLNYNISELFPVNTVWVKETASDPDEEQVYYSLDPNTNGTKYFKLQSDTSPEIILQKPLDYETTKSLQLILHAMETPAGPPNDTLTININVLDEDNKPPEFEPCSEVYAFTASICLNAVYMGNITLGETETGPLQLEPQQIQAVDGDKEIKAVIHYSLGNDHEKSFKIDQNTGEITMIKPVTSQNPVVLTVMAYQENDHYKYSMTTVTLNVLKENKCPPQFTKAIYNGNIQENLEPGSIVFEQSSSSKPLTIRAEDCDFPDKTNPSIKYKITPSDDFTINRDGFIFTKTKLIASRLYALLITATDDEHGQTATTTVKVQVTSNDVPITVTTITQGTGPTRPVGTGTTTISAKTPSKTPPTGSPAVNPRLKYEAKHMAALGVPLAILLIICFIIIGILLHKIHRGKIEWEKLQDGSVNKFSRGSITSHSDKLQFENEGYLEEAKSEGTKKSSWPRWKTPPIFESAGLATILDPPMENSNPTGSSEIQSATMSQSYSTDQENDKVQHSSEEIENDTEVKSILTKERKSDEGYKAVWFKEDIEPEANEEHVIERHDDGEEGEESDLDPDNRNKGGLMLKLKSDDEYSITL